MLEAVSLAAARGDRLVFASLSLRVEPGQAVHVTGANGSGKTTLLRVLAGLLRAECGELRWCGRKLADCEVMPLASHLGHRNGLKMELSALENLHSAAVLYRSNPDRKHAVAALAGMGMADAADVPVGALSQGQQRRVALARVAASGAPLWLLDEPTTALDQESVAVFERLCSRHLEEGGLLVFANHQPLRLPGARLQSVSMEDARPTFSDEIPWFLRSAT